MLYVEPENPGQPRDFPLGYSGGGQEFRSPHVVVVWGCENEEKTAQCQVRGTATARTLSHTPETIRRDDGKAAFCLSARSHPPD